MSCRGGLLQGRLLLITFSIAIQIADPQTSAPGKVSRSLIGMHYEPWFTQHNISWKFAEAQPILGNYSSYDASVIRKHEEWFEDLGIDWLMVDWSNMLWMKPSWESQQGGVRELEETTRLLLETYAGLAAQGKHPPKIVLLLALQNGPPVPDCVRRMNKIIAWIDAHYLAEPRYKNLWLDMGGKPLITIWYSPYDACQKLPALLQDHHLAADKWTVRFVNQQLQVSHTNACGMWSWIDGTIRQQVTYHDGHPEHLVVTPACFPPGGWLAPTATAKDNGVPYLESWKTAFESRPEFISLNQWNEFTGQPREHGYGPQHTTYLDEYSATLSDDLEPTRLGVCGYRGCEPWGYYYFNLTKALISLYRGNTPDITVLALARPERKSSAKTAIVRWAYLGKKPKGYSLRLDGQTVAADLTADSYTLDLSKLHAGKHRLALTAQGVHTFFDLNPERMTIQSRAPLGVRSEVEFTIPTSATDGAAQIH